MKKNLILIMGLSMGLSAAEPKFRQQDIDTKVGVGYGLQLAVVEYARNVAGIPQATSAEFETGSEYEVVCVQENQKETLAANRYGGSMRLGAYAAVLKRESKVAHLYEESGRLEEDAERIRQLLGNKVEAFRVGQITEGHDKVVLERHRHRYER